MFDVYKVRKDFPALSQKVYGNQFIYLDNAATTQKPESVIKCIMDQYIFANGNVHRGVHYLSETATQNFENARVNIQRFLNAAEPEEIVFTKGTTEAINLVCTCLGKNCVKAGDEIVVSAMEHHSNFVPWQMLCQRKKAVLRIVPFDEKGKLDLNKLEAVLNRRTKLVAVTYISNVLGTVNPVNEIIKVAHSRGIPVLIDAAQAAAHIEIDVRKTDTDFLCFSGHKAYGPVGIGVLYGKKNMLGKFEPYQYGGEMVGEVYEEYTTWAPTPLKFEAGTPDYIGACAMSEAINYLRSLRDIGLEEYEKDLYEYARANLKKIPGINVVGEAENAASVISFSVQGMSSYDLALMLDKRGIAIRSGNHCAQILLRRCGVDDLGRISFACYNTKEEVDAVCREIEDISAKFRTGSAIKVKMLGNQGGNKNYDNTSNPG